MKFVDIIVNKLMQGVSSIVKRFLRQAHQLTFCGSSIDTAKLPAAASAPLAELAELIGITERDDSEHEKAEKFVAAIRDLNTRLDIPVTLDALRFEDITQLAIESVKEGRTYAVPLVMARARAASILNKLVA